MKIESSLVLMVAVGWICVALSAPKQIVTVHLNATIYNTAHIAQAVLTPMNSSQTQLTLLVGGVPDDTLTPAHLYTYLYSGSCAKHEPKPAYSLNNLITDNLSDHAVIQFDKTVPLGYDTLRSGHYALVVRASPADGNQDIFCGDLI